jgi:hypothetical protein
MRAAPPSPDRAGLPLWPLALLAGLLPLVAALLAWALSLKLGLVPACIPLVEGCVSISRAARHDLPNHLFRALMLPAATLQGLVWLLAGHWLSGLTGHSWRLRLLSLLGCTAAVALVLYTSFLGTEGAIYRALRHYGTVAYFGFTCLCMLLLGDAVQRLVRSRHLALPRSLVRAHLALAGALVAMGITNAIVAALLPAPWKDRTENVTEWWGALIFVLCFFALAAMWRHLGLRMALRGR